MELCGPPARRSSPRNCAEPPLIGTQPSLQHAKITTKEAEACFHDARFAVCAN